MGTSNVDGTYMCPTRPDHTFDETQPIEVLKKNLAYEEEFRPVDHKEPIHISLKVEPLTGAEARAQADQHLYDFYGETGVSVRPPASSCQDGVSQDSFFFSNQKTYFTMSYSPRKSSVANRTGPTRSWS
jgi:hypothetical protein